MSIIIETVQFILKNTIIHNGIMIGKTKKQILIKNLINSLVILAGVVL